MPITRRSLIAAAGIGATASQSAPRLSRAQAANTIRIGVLNDQSGLYRDVNGPGSVVCVRQAVADSGLAARGINVEVLVGDHQNRPDVGSNIARQWLDRDGVDLILDVPTSSVALAVNSIVREKNKVHMNSSGATSDLTGAQCSPNTVHWTYDTYMLAKSTGGAMVKAGGDTWFFLTADYAFGHALERDTTNFVRASGGRVLGSVRTPFPGNADFSSFLVQAQASRAKVVGLANAGGDTINCVKQAAEFGLARRGVKLAGLLVFISDVHSLGLQTAQGLVITETFYWDLNDRTRAFTARVVPNMPNGLRPGMGQAGCYGAVMHYLKAVADMGAPAAKASGAEAVSRMKAMPCDDDAFGPGTIRPDGRKLHPAYLLEVKAPAESRGPWDYYKLLATTSGDEAFRPVGEGGCALVRS
ncbi:MAG: ABC transporter, substrate-binding protein (cluster 4, leucine/isoleucine/valine/benzoate) [uncultured Acetobacteraceae bacterium]|uniref:ABC transporter, substrate-binding protein (Cluster 4, leucine/isoleucine/valine/benzoate) n=1 Tax=uncultured Acetobacteraceae bacterium TaxID=169975 RepID=A0A6J4GY80_9PROT|nr:MAG: ABC transporter, substrate-binding protein (cluster 4, leucine/isoleucine/valine/benzoate) [uncultured Acetobacteraceae bacterium]